MRDSPTELTPEPWVPPSAPGYAEVAARSNFTLLEGASHPRELVAAAKALGHAGLGLCDLNTLSGAVRGHVAAREAGLRYAVGCRLRLADGSEWLAWPTDRASYGRLARLLSLGKMRAPKGGFDVSLAEMAEHATGWIVAAVPDRAARGGGAPGRSLIPCLPEVAAALAPRLAMPLLVAAWNTLRGDDGARIERLADLAAAVGGRLLATNDLLFHHPDRRRLADVLSAIRLGVPVDALGYAAQPNAERHLKPAAEMARLFRGRDEALRASLDVLDAASSFSLSELRHEYPDEILEPGRTPQQTLIGRVAAALRELWPDGAPEDIRARLRHELTVVRKLDYAPYFLTVHEIVRFARSKGILCQGRGSAANSTICFVLGITAVDPEEHDLLFERFVSASRGEPPDIDVDFEHERREEVIQHVYETYGRERAAIVGTVIRFRSRSAVREGGKALGLSEDVTGKLAKASWGPGGGDLAEIAAGEGLDTGDRRLRLAVELAEEIQDFPRHLATHVGGFVISRGPLVEMAVVQNAAMEGRSVLEWDKDDVEALGMMKVDLLALGMLTCIRRCFDLLRGHRVADLSLAAVPRGCEETYAMLRRADTVGVFQVESRAQMNMLPRVRPANFYDLVVQVALVRPGPIQGDMVHPYLRRRWGLEDPVYPAPHPDHGEPDELERVLGRTLGVPLFQEQAMRLAMVAARYTPDEADRLRRDMATFKFTQGVAAHRDRLVDGMVRRGYEREFAERVFAQIEGFGSYGFPESHAASFAQLAYASAWLKRHHPAAFTCALLNSQPMGFYAPAQLVRDAKEHGVAVLRICVNASHWDSALEREGRSEGGFAIRLGLRVVAGLPEQEGRAVARGRRSGNAAPYLSIADLVRRTGVSKRAVEALAAARALDAIARDRRGALWEARAVERDTPPLFRGDPAAPDREADLFDEPAARLPEETEGQSVVGDYRSTGMTLGRHPLAILRPELDRMGCGDTRQLASARPGSRILLPGLALMRQRPGTAKGVTFVTVEDEWGSANLVVWADVAERDRAALLGARLLLAEGRVERETERAEVPVTHLIVRRLSDATGLLDTLASGEGAVAAMPGSRDFR